MSSTRPMSPELAEAWRVYRDAEARRIAAPLSTWSQPSYRRLVEAEQAAAAQIKIAAAAR